MISNNRIIGIKNRMSNITDSIWFSDITNLTKEKRKKKSSLKGSTAANLKLNNGESTMFYAFLLL